MPAEKRGANVGLRSAPMVVAFARTGSGVAASTVKIIPGWSPSRPLEGAPDLSQSPSSLIRMLTTSFLLLAPPSAPAFRALLVLYARSRLQLHHGLSFRCLLRARPRRLCLARL